MPYLIVGLGNPGKTYAKTRHNIGFMVLQALAQKWGWSWQEKKFQGKWALGSYEGKKVLLLQPSTYMNNSGAAVRECQSFYKIELENILVAADDVDLPFGELRLRQNCSSGGHNGLKSIEKELGSLTYARLRVGIDKQKLAGDLTPHVLGTFSAAEEALLAPLLEKSCEAIELWLDQGLAAAQNLINRKIEGK